MAGGLLMRAAVQVPRAHRRDERGAVAVLAALLSGALFLTAALVIDLGLARDTKRNSQNASDASALAAANALYPDSKTCTSTLDLAPPCYRDAVAAAKSYALTNFGVTEAAWASCSDPNKFWVVPLTTNCVSFTDDALGSLPPVKPTKVRVSMPTRNVDVKFGAGSGVSTVSIGSSARAAVGASTFWGCTLCFLGPMSGINGDFTVNGGNIHVNGSVTAGPNGRWTAKEIGIVGTTTGGSFTPTPVQKPLITDPWASRNDLPPSTLGLPQKNNPCAGGANSGGPGIYGSVTTTGNCTLQPGLYVVTEQWTIQGNATVTSGAGGVTIYFTCKNTLGAPRVCGANEVGAGFDVGSGNIYLTAPTITSPLGGVAGVAVMFDRQNTAQFALKGSGQTHIDGAFYGPSATMFFNGNSCFGFRRGPVIAKTATTANGNTSCLTVLDPLDVTAFEFPGQVALDR